MAKQASRSKTADAIALFKLLADPHRYQAIELLIRAKSKGLSVGDIADGLSLEHSATSHLLASLNDSGVVVFRKEGRTVHYTLAANGKTRALRRIRKAAA